ncbi:MAG: phosphomannomutase/phosphoglucomutase, partial [Anaerolineae bacterium]|nr:phosphomannomutase/phosphoglucomutase [Anaerolineae bacterium]
AYDIRGTVGEALTPEIAERIGQALGSEMSQRRQQVVIVGRDNRLSSPELAEALMTGIRRAGLNTIDIGEAATPTVYHASVTSSAAPAVMITGSHLPPNQNGFKITQGLTPFFGEDIQRLRNRIETGDFTKGEGEHRTDPQAASRYLIDLGNRFRPAERPLKLVVDAGNGMGGLFAPTLLRQTGHEVVELYCEPDGTYPNHPADPFVEANTRDAKKTLAEQQADLALLFDGDADRFGMVDGQGNSYSTDLLLIPVMREIVKKRPGAVIVTDALVSQILINEIKKAGGVPLMWKSGHSNIKNKMKEVHAPLAIETSGHVFIADDYYGYDDGIYTGARMVDLLSREASPTLAELMAALPQLHTSPQYRPRCAEEKKQTVIEAVGQAFSNYDISTVDGVRVSMPAGWFIVRASNTEARLSLRFEAADETALHEMTHSVKTLLEQHGIEMG